MNKILHINLGGYPFTIDEDAYSHLSNYLATIHRHFRNSEGYEEITSDIEGRMAELFQEQLNTRSIVTTKDVKAAISIMGTPEEFGADPIDEPYHETDRKSGKFKTGKRLFRNPEDQAVAGVCSGIAAYFGIEDPIWIRLAFVLGTIFGGFGIPAYIILWVITPEANSAGDRLAMKGEPINVSNIAKTIEEEIDHLSNRLSDLSDDLDLGSKKKELVELHSEKPLRKGFLY